MESIHNLGLKGNMWRCGLLIAGLSLSSCAYRLTNLHVQTPNKIKTIAIESIYDTSSEVIPHDQLWNELQRAFASNGHLHLASTKSADALLRAHIKNASTLKSGDRPGNNGEARKKDIDLYGAAGPIPPSANRNLSVATDYFTKDRLSMLIDIEVWDLKTRELILQRTYSGSFDTLAARPGELPELMTIRHEESSERGVAKIARTIAETVVSDLLVR